MLPADTAYTNNSEFLFNFLQESQMYIPSAFRFIAPHKRITYREINSDKFANILNPHPRDWSVLDYVLFPQFAKSLHPVISSDTMIHFGSRHFPVIATFKMHKRPRVVPPKPVQRFLKPTTSQFSSFHELQNASILESPHPNSSNLVRVHVYTDGSCPDNRNIHRFNPAGWGFTYKYEHSPEQWNDSYGPVSTFTDDPWYVGASVGSNNTAELTAVIEALDVFLRLKQTTDFLISPYIDSQLTIDIITGSSSPTNNLILVSQLRSHYNSLSQTSKIIMHKVESHTGIEGNERADMLANKGVESTSFLAGRFLHSPPQPLCTPTPSQRTLVQATLNLDSHYGSLKTILTKSATSSLDAPKVKVKTNTFLLTQFHLSHKETLCHIPITPTVSASRNYDAKLRNLSELIS
jgi:ribonuclease HI